MTTISSTTTTTSSTSILVTGGLGFIGANLVRLLVDEGHSVRVLDNFEAGVPAYLGGLNNVEVLRGDILDPDAVRSAVEGEMAGGAGEPAAVVHLAAQTGVPGSIADPRKDMRVNVEGTLNLLEALRPAARKAEEEGGAPPRFVFASSNAPLGRRPPPATEDKAPLPISPYGASKLAGEAYCLAYHGSWGVGTVVFRFGNVYGPFSAHKSSVVASFFNDIADKGEITVDGDGGQTRDFIYVEDLCRAVLLGLRSDVAGEVFQIATGVETSINELAAMVTELADRDVDVDHGPPRRGDVARNYSVIRKAREVLGWEPEVGLKDGLRRTSDWFGEWTGG